jgi:hypothetical protein
MPDLESDFLFPTRAIPQLRGLRGENWQKLVDQVSAQPAEGLDRLAFVLFMVRLGGCITCQADSYRAMRGCVQCSSQTIRRFRSSDQELLRLFGEAKLDMENYLEKREHR